MSIKFVRSHETYNDIQFFLYDYVKEHSINCDDIIVSMRYDEKDKIEMNFSCMKIIVVSAHLKQEMIS